LCISNNIQKVPIQKRLQASSATRIRNKLSPQSNPSTSLCIPQQTLCHYKTNTHTQSWKTGKKSKTCKKNTTTSQHRTKKNTSNQKLPTISQTKPNPNRSQTGSIAATTRRHNINGNAKYNTQPLSSSTATSAAQPVDLHRSRHRSIKR